MCLCACLTSPSCASALPKELCHLILQSKPSSRDLYCLLEWHLGVITRWPGGAWTLTQTWTLPPDPCVVKVLSAPKSLNELCGIWIPIRFVEDAEIEASSEPSGLFHRTTFLSIRAKILYDWAPCAEVVLLQQWLVSCFGLCLHNAIMI